MVHIICERVLTAAQVCGGGDENNERWSEVKVEQVSMKGTMKT